jgi:multimeric flavodoxin WrbA
MTKIVIVYYSGRGHTAKVAHAVQDGAREVVGAETVCISTADVDQHWPTLAAADAIIFGAPTYMGSAAAGFKEFMDKSAKVWLAGGWRDKIAAGFTCSGSLSGDKLNTLVQLAVFAAQHGMLWVGLELPSGQNRRGATADSLNRVGCWLGVAAQANVDEGADVVPPAADLATARHLGRRVAATAQRLNAGVAATTAGAAHTTRGDHP